MANPANHGPLRPGRSPDMATTGDAEWAEYVAWLDREAAAGRGPDETWVQGSGEPWDAEPGEPDFPGLAAAAMAGPLFAEDADALPHHRAKQAPDWHVEQLAPGVTRWTMPSGRTHVTTPTTYDSQ